MERWRQGRLRDLGMTGGDRDEVYAGRSGVISDTVQFCSSIEETCYTKTLNASVHVSLYMLLHPQSLPSKSRSVSYCHH